MRRVFLLLLIGESTPRIALFVRKPCWHLPLRDWRLLESIEALGSIDRLSMQWLFLFLVGRKSPEVPNAAQTAATDAAARKRLHRSKVCSSPSDQHLGGLLRYAEVGSGQSLSRVNAHSAVLTLDALCDGHLALHQRLLRRAATI